MLKQGGHARADPRPDSKLLGSLDARPARHPVPRDRLGWHSGVLPRPACAGRARSSEARLEGTVGVSTKLLEDLARIDKRTRQVADRRVELEKQILELGGLVNLNNVWWLDGRPLRPRAGLEVLHDGTWQPCTMDKFGNRVRLRDGAEVRLMDLDHVEFRRPAK